jgi:hypothetical protein
MHFQRLALTIHLPSPMFLCALGNSVPEFSLSQSDCFEVLKQHRAYEELSARGKEICKLVLTGDNGISHRFTHIRRAAFC